MILCAIAALAETNVSFISVIRELKCELALLRSAPTILISLALAPFSKASASVIRFTVALASVVILQYLVSRFPI